MNHPEAVHEHLVREAELQSDVSLEMAVVIIAALITVM
jgi:hypothetical protein